MFSYASFVTPQGVEPWFDAWEASVLPLDDRAVEVERIALSSLTSPQADLGKVKLNTPVVTSTGFEPVLCGLKNRLPSPLEEPAVILTGIEPVYAG